jgi:putative ABC transport system substrate-binding protein
LPDLAAELVRLNVDIIVSVGTQGVTAAKNATDTIPIVMIGVRDPIGTGSSRASRGRAGTSQECPAAPAWKSSPNSWSCSRRRFPKSAV